MASAVWGDSSQPSISADGQLVAFESTADNLVANDHNGTPDPFVYNRSTGAVTLVSVGANGMAAGLGTDGSDPVPVISPDGRYVAFDNNEGNVLPGVTGSQLYLRNLATGTTTLVAPPSAAAAGTTPLISRSLAPTATTWSSPATRTTWSAASPRSPAFPR